MDLGKLNPPQREAVTHGGGPLLVLAGAGSGKTRVITHRIAHLLSQGVPPRTIAALTFTNKAAEEMRHRVGGLVGDRQAAHALTIGTFHSLGLTLLKEERAALGFPRGFTVFDAADQMGTVRELMRRLKDADRRFDAKAVLARISLAKNAFIAPEDYEVAEGDEYDGITAEIYPRYQDALRAFAAVDFDDLITETVRLAERDPLVRERWRGRFLHVMVDEYQDTNRAQLLLVGELTAAHGNLCVVGDDDQSIYGWRGAEAANILGFAKMFKGAHVVKLEQNYRSTPTILAAANAVIANNPTRHDKRLWTERPDGPLLVAVVARAPDEEAKFVVGEMDRLRREDGRRWSDLAVLYRSNLQSEAFEAELRERQVPFALFGGQQFYERKEVKDLLAYLRLALNSRDEIALRRVINYPARGIGATTIDRLASYSQANRVTLWTALAQTNRIDPPLTGAARAAVAGFVAVIEELRGHLDDANGVVAAVRALLESIGLIEDIRAGSPSLTAAQRRIDNVERLIASLDRRSREHPGREALMDYLRLLSLSGADQESDGAAAGDKVTLTTLHGAKGLEFPVVFLVGVEEELLPHARTLAPIATDVSDPECAGDVTEERRLAYVGITRARELLYLTRCLVRHRHGKERLRTPSRFLFEIPAELMETRDLAQEARAPVPESELRAFLQSFK